MRDDYDSTGNIPSIDPEDMRREVEQRLQGGALAGSIEIKTDKDGKARWLGMALSPDVAAVLQYAFSMAQPIINKQGAGFLYDKVGNVVKWWNPSAGVTAHKAGLTAAKLFMGAIIAAQPVDQLLHARRKRAEERKELFDDLAPIIQTTNGSYKQNTVIKSALDRIHDETMTNIKKVAADIPVVALATYFAAKDYHALSQRKDTEFHTRQQANKPPQSAHEDYRSRWEAEEARIEEAKQKMRENFTGDEKTLERKLEKYEEMAWNDFREKDSIRSKDQENHKELSNDVTAPYMIAAGGASYIMRSKFDRAGKKDKGVIALDLIKELRQENENSTVSHLNERIIEIFQQNERDEGRPVIGKKLLSSLQPAIDRIATAIEEEGLDPLALVNLVGDGKVVMHHNGERRFATLEQVNELIHEQLKVLHTAEVITSEEFFTNFANPRFVQETLKKNLAAMPPEQQAMVAAMFPAEVLEKMGYKKEAVAQLQKHGHDQMYFLVGAIVMDIAARSPEKLQKLGLSEEDVQSINQLAEKIEAGDLQALKVAVDGRDKTILAATRTAALTEQVETGNDPWTSRVRMAADVKQKLEVSAAEKVEAEKNKKVDLAEKPAGTAVSRELNRRSDEPEHTLGA